MQTRIWIWAVLACATCACTHLEGNGQAPQRAIQKAPPVPRQEGSYQPLPTITVSGRAATRYGLHTSGACAKKDCDPIEVTVVAVDGGCKMDQEPQWLGLDRTVDWFVVKYELSAASAAGAQLTSIHEKGSSASNPADLFHNQKVLANGKQIVVDDVGNHFLGVKHSVIEAKLNGKACAPLDPPVIPDY